MAGFHLYSSNRQERLVARLARLLRERPPAAALAAETILVQNYGMQRWVALELARINGIEANTRFIFPNELLQLAFSAVIPGGPAAAAPSREELAWSIMAVLPPLLDRIEFASLRHYLQGSRPLKLWQLAGRLAGLLDQYAMYRPEMLLAWEQAASCVSREDAKARRVLPAREQADSRWQALLWQGLPAELRQRLRPALRREFFQHLDAALSRPHRLPERISIFGLCSLPPLHVEVLSGLARSMEVHLFFLNPTDQYWGELLPGREILRRTEDRRQRTEDRRHKAADTPESIAADLHLDAGNPLLASLGRYGQEFLQLLLDRDLIDDLGEADFVPPEGEGLLHRLQRDILELADPGSRPGARMILAPADRFLQIHACHSPMREVEVLHDQLLHLLDTTAGLRPSDIVVMTPDIETYAPLIQSVFGAQGPGGERFPFAIADRDVRRESRVIRYFLRLLAVPEGRFTVTEVFELLESEPLRARFELSPEEVDTIRQMVVRANVRWGIDADFRARLNLPAIRETTWEFGIERILTGYGLPAGERQLFGSVLPFDDIEGSRAAAFGRFLVFFERLRELVEPGPCNLGSARGLPAWAGFLEGLLSRFFLEDEAAGPEFALLRSVFAELRAPAPGLDLEVAAEVIAAYLDGRLQALSARGGFLGFGVTFCSMMPMRAIPFAVIALLGMNDGAFPRLDRPLSFDLLRQQRRLGDRSLKDEDRYLFLEIILSCRQVLYISYVGQSSRDNSSLPASTLVAELLDYLEQGYEVEGGWLRDHLVTRHPLQPFSSRYFQGDGRLFSYSAENLAAARQLQAGGIGPTPLFTARLPVPGPEFGEVSVELLARFFANPARFLFHERLGVRLDEEQEPSPDEETFGLDALARYGLQTRLLALALEPGAEATAAKPLFSASGSLPLSQAGDLAFTAIAQELADFSARLTDILGGQRPLPLAYDFSLAGCQLRGVITCCFEQCLIRWRPASVKTKDRLLIRLEQLIASLVRPPGCPAMLIGLDKESGRAEVFQLPAVTDPEAELQRLLGYFRQGLCQPLAFFPRTAQSYMEALFDGDGDRSGARQKAEATWLGSEFKAGEMAASPYFLRCFQGVDLFNETDFEQIVLDLLLPIYKVQRRI